MVYHQETVDVRETLSTQKRRAKGIQERMKISEIKDVLVINPGSTSTKIGVFSVNEETVKPVVRFEENIVHDEERILGFDSVADKTGEVYPGGNPVNVAVHIARLSNRAS